MEKNYKYYLGSACKRDYEESVQHVINDVNYLYGKGYLDLNDNNKQNLFDQKKIKETYLEKVLRWIALGVNVLGALGNISRLGTMYEAKASSDLLLNADVNTFKQDVYVAGKLSIISSENIRIGDCFLSIMSDNKELIDYTASFANLYSDKYVRSDPYIFFRKNILLALAGEWEQLKPRAEMFVNEPNRKRYKNHIPDHEFYIALCNGDIINMEEALNKLLTKRIAKQRMNDLNVWFDFYLQMDVIMYAKIASIHGYDLDIDSPIAPKELIKYEPLEHYEDPYDFMKDFDYNDHQGWIDMWEEKMRIAKEEEAERKKLKNRILSWFKK